MRKRIFFVLFVSFFLIPFISSDLMNSSNYSISIAISDGGGNTNSSNYTQIITTGKVGGVASGGNYSSALGFLGSTKDATPPKVTINSPLSTAYSSGTLGVDIRLNEPGSCKYSLNSGTTNYSMIANNSNTGFTAATLELSNGAYTIYAYCNDTAGNKNYTTSVLFTVSIPAPTTSSSPGGAGGGATPSENVVPVEGLEVNPTSMNLYSTAGILDRGKISLSNPGEASIKLEVSLVGLESLVTLNKTSIELEAGESKTLDFEYLAEKAGIYTGKIIFSSESQTTEVLISLNIKSEKSLFDISVDIPDRYKTIKPGNKLTGQITLIQAGIQEKMDVTINYVIKDFEGKTYLRESETIAVEGQKSYSKEFQIQSLPGGSYVLGAEVIYSGGVATASSHFNIKEDITKSPSILFFVLPIVIITVFILLVVLIKKYKRPLQYYKTNKKRGKSGIE